MRRPAAAATAAAALAVCLLPAAGTTAAWTDDASISATGGPTAVTVPAPVLTCAPSGNDAVVSWPAASLPGDPTPEVGYAARVVQTGLPLTVSGTTQRSVTVTPLLLTPAVDGATRTVRVTASVGFGGTTWTATADQQVTYVSAGLSASVTCAT